MSFIANIFILFEQAQHIILSQRTNVNNRPWIVHKSRFHVCHFRMFCNGNLMMRGFIKGVSVDVSYL